MRELIPILGMIFVLGPPALWAFSVTPLGRALADRLRGRPQEDDNRLLDIQDEIERLGELIANQDHRIEELHDRLDFTERLLTRGSAVEIEPGRAATPG